MTPIDPINSMLIHTIISCHVQMVIINGFGGGHLVHVGCAELDLWFHAGFGVVIWPKWVVLSQICGWGMTKIRCDLPNF
jgi:type IV secretory pathway TrbD component